jgi:hypothetical protein
VDIWQRRTAADDGTAVPAPGAWRWVALAVAMFGTTYFRNQTSAVLAASVALVFGIAAVRALLRSRWQRAGIAAGLVVVVTASMIAAREIDFIALLSLTPRPPRGVVESVTDTVGGGIFWLSVQRISDLRAAEVLAGGTTIVDPQITFDGPLDLIAYLPRAFLIAYLSPLPSQLLFTGGQTGPLRQLAAPEILLIALLLPSFLVACVQRMRRFCAEEWFLIVFVFVVGLAHAIIMVNTGTLFRLRLQYLFPTIVIASTALPAFVHRAVGLVEARGAPAPATDAAASRA